MRHLLPFFVLWMSLVVVMICTAADSQRLLPAGQPGAWSGFDLQVEGNVIARVRLGSNGLFVARTLEHIPGGGLRFKALEATQGCGVQFAPASFVEVTPGPASDPFPKLTFDLQVKTFDKEQWEKALGGACPFHFLTLQVPDAEALHHRGFLVATPRLDAFTLLKGRQEIVASAWSHTWTWAPPFGACPIPLAGLWAPQHEVYAAYDFMESRLFDHSEQTLASSYCWKQGKSGDFLALVFPYGAPYTRLRYPTAPFQVKSACRLLYNTDLPYWKDPNEWYHQRLWRNYKAWLPSVSTNNVLDWLPYYARPWKEPEQLLPLGSLLYTVPEKDQWESHFFEPGTKLLTGPSGERVEAHFAANDKAGLQQFQQQLDYLIDHLTWFNTHGERCCYWPKPFEGKTKPNFNTDVTTLRNIHGWILADIVLTFWEYTHQPRYLEVADGILNWTKYNICTRNAISDVPEAMFTMGWPGVRFLLRYHRLFENDSQRGEQAELALELAHRFAYRYNTLFIPDNAVDDDLDGTFLVEPNSAKPWTGQPCANECNDIPEGLLRVYVATGDPILLQYIEGMVEQWHLLYRDQDAQDIKTTGVEFTEAWGLYDGCSIGGRKVRAPYGVLWGMELLKPVGKAKAKVVCGEKGAAVFSWKGDVVLADYRASKGLKQGFAFKLAGDSPEAFVIDVAAPNHPIADLPVYLEHSGKIAKLEEGKGVVHPINSLRNLEIRGVQSGDTVYVGNPAAPRTQVALAPIKPVTTTPPDFSRQGFELVPLADQADFKPSLDWEDNTSFAPLKAGVRYAWGVPYFIIPARLNEGKAALQDAQLRLQRPVEALALVISKPEAGAKVTLTLQTGARLSVDLEQRLEAWKAWPKWFTQALYLVPVVSPEAAITAVEAKGVVLWALTLPAGSKGQSAIEAAVQVMKEQKAEAARLEAAKRAREAELKQGYALLLEAKIKPGSDHDFAYLCFARRPDNDPWVIPPNSYLEYDMMVPFSSSQATGAVDLTSGNVHNIRDQVPHGHPTRKVEQVGVWVHYKTDLLRVAGKTFTEAVVATDGFSPGGVAKVYFRSICITDGNGKVLVDLYHNQARLDTTPTIARNGGERNVLSATLKVVPVKEATADKPAPAFVVHGNTALEDFSEYPEGATGEPNWYLTTGNWRIERGLYVGSDCDCSKQWHPDSGEWKPKGASAGDASWRDYEAEITFRIVERGSDWRDGAWIGFRADRYQWNCYSLNIHDRQVVLHKHYMGRQTNDKLNLGTAPWTLDTAWHTVRIRVNEARITVWMDDKLLLQAKDDNYLDVPPIPSGGIILCARRYSAGTGHTVVAFKQVKVTLLKQ